MKLRGSPNLNLAPHTQACLRSCTASSEGRGQSILVNLHSGPSPGARNEQNASDLGTRVSATVVPEAVRMYGQVKTVIGAVSSFCLLRRGVGTIPSVGGRLLHDIRINKL